MHWHRRQQEHNRIAANFVLENARDFHDGFGTKAAVLNEDEDNIEELPASADLKQSLEAYNESVDAKFKFDIHLCTLEDVVVELNHARGQYDDEASGLSGALHEGLRKMGDYADQIDPWLDLIPSDHGLCFLSAGLKIIFGIAKQNSANRDKILKAFDNIPNLIMSAKRRQNQWASAKYLRLAAIELYDALARAMAQLIFLLNGSMSHKPRWSERALKIIRRVSASPDTGRSIDSLLSNVENQAGVFDQCLEHVRDQRHIDNAAGISANGVAIAANGTGIADNGRLLKSMAEKEDVRYAAIMKRLDEIPSGPSGPSLGLSGPEMMNLAYHIVKYLGRPQDGAFDDLESQPARNPEPLLDELELHDILRVSPQHPVNDIELILKEVDQFSPSAQAQAQQLLTSSVFASWMASTQPASLLVHGNFAESGAGRITPLSMLCAMFVLQLRRSSSADNKLTIALHYFCGLHGSLYNRLDSLAGPNGLIRSILAQLLQTGRHFNLDFINTNDFVQRLEAHNTQKLCSTFFELVEQLPRKYTIICILDGLSEFTSQKFQDGLVDVIHIFNRLVTHRTLRCKFKLLCTTPFARDRLLDQHLSVDHPLQLQHAIEDAYEPAFTGRALPHLMSQNSRSDYYRMRMQEKKAAEQANYSDTDSEYASD